MLQIREGSDALKKLYNSEVSIVKKSNYDYLLLLNISSFRYGMIISFLDNTIIIRDANGDDGAAKILSPLPRISDYADKEGTLIQGLFSHLAAVFSGTKFHDRVAVSMKFDKAIASELESYFEALAAFHNLTELLEAAQDIQQMADNDRLVLSVTQKLADQSILKFLFNYSMGSGYSVRVAFAGSASFMFCMYIHMNMPFK